MVEETGTEPKAMQNLKSPKVVFDPKTGRFFFSTNWIRVNTESKKVRMLEKIDITGELDRVLEHIAERARLEAKRNRITDDTRKIVCLCGSTRFKAEFEAMNLELTMKGHIVLTVGAFPHTDEKRSPEEAFGDIAKYKLDETHKRKIDLADIIYFINVDGYMGKSTLSEYHYAKTCENKIIIFHDDKAAQEFLDSPASKLLPDEAWSPSEPDITSKFEEGKIIEPYGHDNPPPGFAACTREKGHEGPCAHPLLNGGLIQ